MARADELVHGERIVHPTSGEIVVVQRVTCGLSATKVYFKAKGQSGWFKSPPHAEIKEIP